MKRLILLLMIVIGAISSSYEKIVDTEAGLILEKDVPIEMRDGIVLYGNVFRPIKDGKYPVITSMGSYGKDNLPMKYDKDEGNIEVSLEVVDPVDWVPHGYVVVTVDSRGICRNTSFGNRLQEGRNSISCSF